MIDLKLLRQNYFLEKIIVNLRQMKLKALAILIPIATMLMITSCLQSSKRQLPIYKPSDLNPELVDKSLQNSNDNHTVADFKLINQNGRTITQDDYKDKIYVTDFFFTRC